MKRPLVELHRRSCRCAGLGFIHYPGGQVDECRSRHIMLVTFEEWERAGRPRTADEYEEFILKAALIVS